MPEREIDRAGAWLHHRRLLVLVGAGTAVVALFLAFLLRPSGQAAPRLEAERFSLITAGR